jgi:hypothetical protein
MEKITQAITTSKKARAAGLFYIENSEVENIQTTCNQNKIRFCTIHLPRRHYPARNTQLKQNIDLPQHKNTNNVKLLLWETQDMNPFDTQTLELELKVALNINSPEALNQQILIPWKYQSKNTTRSEIRRSPFTFP